VLQIINDIRRDIGLNPFEDAREGLRQNPPASLAAVPVLTVAEQEFQAGGSPRLHGW
jgi:hypothetical protein